MNHKIIDIEKLVKELRPVAGNFTHAILTVINTCEIMPVKLPNRIHLDQMIDMDIDMEFQSENDSSWAIGKLNKIIYGGKYPYFDNYGESWSKCRIRQDHWHSWDGEVCPLPSGLTISVRGYSDDGNKYITNTDSDDNDIDWNYVSAFSVHGVDQGWKY